MVRRADRGLGVHRVRGALRRPPSAAGDRYHAARQMVDAEAGRFPISSTAAMERPGRVLLARMGFRSVVVWTGQSLRTADSATASISAISARIVRATGLRSR